MCTPCFGAVSTIATYDRCMISAQPFVYLLFRPWERLQRLHPFEIGDRDATGVGENVRQHQHATIVEDVVSFGVVGPFAASAISDALIRPAFSLGDLIFQRSRNQDLAIELPALLH